MKIACLLIIVGALCCIEGIAIFYTGWHVRNVLILITGVLIGLGMGVILFMAGLQRWRALQIKGAVDGK